MNARTMIFNGAESFDKERGMMRPRTMTAREWKNWAKENPALAWQETATAKEARANFST